MEAHERDDLDPTPGDAGAEPSLAGFASHALDFAHAWGNLLAGEAALAKSNAVLLVAGVVLLLTLLLTTFVAVDAVIAASVFALLPNWIVATASALLVDVAAMIALLLLLRGWWRSLSLPQSRAALKRLWRTPDEREKGRQGADARGAT